VRDGGRPKGNAIWGRDQVSCFNWYWFFVPISVSVFCRFVRAMIGVVILLKKGRKVRGSLVLCSLSLSFYFWGESSRIIQILTLLPFNIWRRISSSSLVIFLLKSGNHCQSGPPVGLDREIASQKLFFWILCNQFTISENPQIRPLLFFPCHRWSSK
jgi:hypothetical protein